MRQFDISSGNGLIRPTVRTEIEAICHFPNDDRAVRQACYLIHDEYRSFLSHPDGFEISELSDAVVKRLQARSTQLHTCGVVALAMCHLGSNGQLLSIEKAAKIASEQANAQVKTPFSFWSHEGWKNRPVQITGDLASIKKVFRKLRPVAHICAARVACGEHIHLRGIFQPFDESDACFISTIRYYQSRLSEYHNYKTWNAWHLDNVALIDESVFLPLLPSEETLSEYKSFIGVTR